MGEYTPRAVAENLPIGERAIDCRAHCTEIALADLRVDGRAGQLAVGKLGAGGFTPHRHLLEKLGSDLMTKPARPAVDGHDHVFLSKPENSGSGGVENLGHGLNL